MLHNVFKVAQTEHSTSVSSPLKRVLLLTTPGSRVKERKERRWSEKEGTQAFWFFLDY